MAFLSTQEPKSSASRGPLTHLSPSKYRLTSGQILQRATPLWTKLEGKIKARIVCLQVRERSYLWRPSSLVLVRDTKTRECGLSFDGRFGGLSFSKCVCRFCSSRYSCWNTAQHKESHWFTLGNKEIIILSSSLGFFLNMWMEFILSRQEHNGRGFIATLLGVLKVFIMEWNKPHQGRDSVSQWDAEVLGVWCVTVMKCL